MEINWSELVIFAIVIIANVIGGIIKIIQKRQKAEMQRLPEFDTDDEYAGNDFFAEEYSDVPQIAEIPVQNIPSPHVAEEPPQSVNEITVEEIDEDNDSFDYGGFMRSHGREAFILAEIILPPNSRQSSGSI